MSVAYGFWRYGKNDLDTALSMIEAARNAGVTQFDTADVYGYPDFGAAEALLGDIRIKAPDLLKGAQIATKAGVEVGTPYNSSGDYVTAAIEGSLRRLRVDAVDLFYIHRPDLMTHPRDLAQTLDEIVASGKAKAVGVSNFTATQVMGLCTYMRAPIAAHQVEFSALCPAPVHNGVFDHAMQEGYAVYAWSPLAGGRLVSGEDVQSVRVRDALSTLAAERGCSLSAAALSFVLSHPVQPTAIIGTKKPARLLETVEASAHLLSRKEWYAIYQASMGEKLP